MKPFRCKHCQRILGTVEAGALRPLGCQAFTLPGRARLQCACGRVVEWRPVVKVETLDNGKALCYSTSVPI